MNNIQKACEDQEYIGEGFERLQPKLVSNNPPKIKWGMKYQEWNDQEKIAFLEKFGSSMNHAAALIQGERNELGKLCELKEQQLMQQQKTVDQVGKMMEQEITRMNSMRQSYNAEIARLNQRIRELEGGDNY